MSYEKRVTRVGRLGAIAAAAWVVGCSDGEDAAPAGKTAAPAFSLSSAVARLKAGNPTAKVRVQGDRIRRIYGVAATGKSPADAAERFRLKSATAFGVEAHELVTASSALKAGPANGVGLMYDRATGKYKFRLYTYEQQRDGIPVFRSGLRTLVREGKDNPVVWANADLRPLGDFRPTLAPRPRSVDLRKALQALQTSAALAKQGLVAPAALANASTPEATIFAGTGSQVSAPRLATRFTAEDANGPGKWTFIADAASGDILFVESNLHFDVTGTVEAEIIADSESMECGQFGVVPVPHAVVSSPSATAVTSSAGAFKLVQSGTAPVTLVSTMSGQYFDVTDEAGNSPSLSLEVTPPGPASFLHEDPENPPELELAHYNAYTQANLVRDLLLFHLPDYPVIAGQTDFPIVVNRTGLTCDQTGGAWYDNDSPSRSINFCQRTTERANTAFGAIIHHEYGHHIVDAGGSQQGEYGEGMADTIAMLVSKDPRIGVGYHYEQCDTELRSADNDCQYSETDCSSCGSFLYDCSLVLSGTIWDIWQELDVTEPETSDSLIRSLVFSSIPLHTGDVIDESIAIDLLTLDDDDELLENGTPHYAEICSGFQQHGMACPPIVDGLVVKGAGLASEGPSDGPFVPESASYTLHNLGPAASLSFSVTVPPNTPWLTVTPSAGTIPLGEPVTVTVSIDQEQAALLPDGDYTATLGFVNETSGTGTVERVAKLRVGAPVPIYTAPFDGGLDGFTPDEEPGNLWHHSTGCVDGLPGHSAPGNLHYAKPELCEYTTPVPIRHTITSPPIVIDNPAMAELGFNYYLETEFDPNYDNAEVLVSVGDGPFQVVASNNSGGVKLNETDAWEALRFPISELLPPAGPSTVRVQLAFNAVDPQSNTNLGFAVDDITVYAQVETCAADVDCDDGVFCNGVETCVEERCVTGTPVICDDGDACTTDACEGDACTHEDNGTCSENSFIELNGRVVIEAEHFMNNTPRSAHRWDLMSNGQASSGAMMWANPNSNQFINDNYAATSPELSYAVRFTTTGTYYVWLRGIGQTANDDSCHVGIDGAQTASADRITGFGSSLSWTRNTMDGPAATLQVAVPGVHDINLWMREDGLFVDKLVLTRSASFVPSGAGPAESERDGPGPCAAHCANPTSFTSANFQSGNLGTAATCHEKVGPLQGGVCGNFVNPRKLLVNGVAMPCTWTPWPSLPPAQNGGYCIQTTSGNHSYAAFATW